MSNGSRTVTNPSENYDWRPGPATVFPATGPTFESQAARAPDEDDYHPELIDVPMPPGGVLEGTSRVRWADNDRASPCYSHLLVDGGDDVITDKAFKIGRAEMDLLIGANRYVPVGSGDLMVFGLRGARLRGGDRFEQVDQLPLEDVRPDHLNFRCVIGYYFRATGKFSAFTASTVPWHVYMEAGKPNNLLPPGCYVYKKSVHRPANEDRWVDPAFRLSDAKGSESGLVTVLRTTRDAVYDLTDTWDKCTPGDNIHCAYFDDRFSSQGCQTIKGGMHDGLWARFQTVIKGLPAKARVDYLLATGAEASIAATLLRGGKKLNDPETQKRLWRLRMGSEGEEVLRIQAALGLQPSAYFGAATKKQLIDAQIAKGLPPDGIYSPATEKAFGWSVFSAAPPALQPAGPDLAPTPVLTPAPTLAVAVSSPPASLPASSAMPAPVTAGIVAPVGTPAATPPTSPVVPPVTPVAPASRPAVVAAFQMTRSALQQAAPRPNRGGQEKRAKIWDAYVDGLTSPAAAQVLTEYGLDKTPPRAMFILANMLQETGGLQLIRENMNYSAKVLFKQFGRAANMDEGEAEDLAGKGEEIADRVYGLGNPRMAKKLGNKERGDGWRFRGGGFLQTTGRDNYRTLGQRIGVDLENHPELIEDPIVSLKAACAEWQRSKLNEFADQGSFRACCNGINFGQPRRDGDPTGFDERLDYLKRTIKAFNQPMPKRAAGALEGTAVGGDLQLGDINSDVATMQRRLEALGYTPGTTDGTFTTRTRDAVLIFQAHNALPITGIGDHATLDLLAGPEAILFDLSAEPRETPVHKSTPSIGSPPPPRPPAPRPEFRKTPALARGWATTTLVLACLGLIGTLAVLALLIGAFSTVPGLRTLASDAAMPLMVAGWITAVVGAAQALRSRSQST
jgi:putative chitinase